MRALRWSAGLLLLVSAVRVDAEEPAVDFTKPESVLGAVFQAASSGRYEALAGLCDPKKENDGDTQRICDVGKAEASAQEEFAQWFKTGKITGEATISGDSAEVPFSFGPDGSKTETMRLVQRDGKWYLAGF